MTEAIRFERVVRSFGATQALNGVSFSVTDGEFFSMLGPSGSGKTTCLRLIAGFDRPTSGEILLAGRSAAATPPWERDVNTVFQDYALFPHMTVRENVAYGLMVRGERSSTRRAKADTMLAQVALDGFGDRRTVELSGGQRQRVALARALVLEPRVLLLDEPLGALDLKLRQQMQGELRALQRRVGITFVYVTHDQNEALGMSDRIAVFDHGKIEQIGTPREIYDRPATAFVADFVGAGNVLPGALLNLPHPVAIRPERLSLGPGQITMPGTVTARHFLGSDTRIEARLADGSPIAALIAQTDPDLLPALGSAIQLSAERAAFIELTR